MSLTWWFKSQGTEEEMMIEQGFVLNMRKRVLHLIMESLHINSCWGSWELSLWKDIISDSMFKNTEVTVKGFKTVQYFQLFYFYLCYNYVIFLIYFAAKLLFSYLTSFSSCVMFSYVTVVLCFAFSCVFSVYTQTCRHFHTTSLLYRVTEKNSKDFTHVYAHTGWVLPDAGPRGLA